MWAPFFMAHCVQWYYTELNVINYIYTLMFIYKQTILARTRKPILPPLSIGQFPPRNASTVAASATRRAGQQHQSSESADGTLFNLPQIIDSSRSGPPPLFQEDVPGVGGNRRYRTSDDNNNFPLTPSGVCIFMLILIYLVSFASSCTVVKNETWHDLFWLCMSMVDFKNDIWTVVTL